MRVAVHTPDAVGERMAGPAIRAFAKKRVPLGSQGPMSHSADAPPSESGSGTDLASSESIARMCIPLASAYAT